MSLFKCFNAKIRIWYFLPLLLLSAVSCEHKTKEKGINFKYKTLKKSFNIENYTPVYDTANLFDSKAFIPGVDSFENLLERIDTLWKIEEELIEKQGGLDTVTNPANYSPDDRIVIKENVKMLDSFLSNKNTTLPEPCVEKECMVYIEIVKSTQNLYLYLDGEISDSFRVSTGIKGRETPNFNIRPTGPMFKKYTSKKFPGGNFEGLGNMPYAIFIKGGFAVHGTTVGNFTYLGTPASHGCIRLHPNNAKILYELVKSTGLENTWVRITN